MIGTVVDLHSRADGTAVALLDAAPWLVRIEGTDEASLATTPIPIDTALEGGLDIHVASDGSIYVHRRTTEGWAFHEFEATGETIWAFEESTERSKFAGFAENGSGRVLGGGHRDGSMEAFAFSAAGTEVLARAEYRAFGTHFSTTSVHDFIVLSDTDFVFASNGGEFSDAFLAKFRDGAGEGVRVSARSHASISSVILDGDVLYVGQGSNYTNAYAIELRTYSTDLEPGWQDGFTVYEDAYAWNPRFDVIYQRAALAKVVDGFVVGTTLRKLTDGTQTEFLRLLGTDGSFRGTIGGMGPVRQLVLAGPHSVFVVWSPSLRPDDATSVSLVELPPT